MKTHPTHICGNDTVQIIVSIVIISIFIISIVVISIVTISIVIKIIVIISIVIISIVVIRIVIISKFIISKVMISIVSVPKTRFPEKKKTLFLIEKIKYISFKTFTIFGKNSFFVFADLFSKDFGIVKRTAHF